MKIMDNYIWLSMGLRVWVTLGAEWTGGLCGKFGQLATSDFEQAGVEETTLCCP